MTEYVVSVSNVFCAESPRDAALQMAAWLSDDAYHAGYRAESDAASVFIDLDRPEEEEED